MKRIALISTGGTIEKTYDQYTGALGNHVSNLDVMLSSLRLEGARVGRVPLLNKDSLDMSEADHELIATTAQDAAREYEGVVVVHGTDRLAITGERTFELGAPGAPIVFTGAMLPYELRRSDALQNLTEALVAVQILSAGVYCVIHNQVLTFPGVKKDRARGTFFHPDKPTRGVSS